MWPAFCAFCQSINGREDKTRGERLDREFSCIEELEIKEVMTNSPRPLLVQKGPSHFSPRVPPGHTHFLVQKGPSHLPPREPPGHAHSHSVVTPTPTAGTATPTLVTAECLSVTFRHATLDNWGLYRIVEVGWIQTRCRLKSLFASSVGACCCHIPGPDD